MAIQLYRAGNSHTVKGIECEVCNFSIGELQIKLDEGWFKSPQEISNGNEESNEKESEAVPEEKDIEPQEEKDGVLNPVRVQAKAAGIEGWDNKRIKTLEGLLNERQN